MNKARNLHIYAIASGSNRRHHAYGSPRNVVADAHRALEAMPDIDLVDEAVILSTPAMGAAKRQFANSALFLATPLNPPALLERLKDLEQSFGRRRGQRWGDRVLDLDIILWSGGIWAESGLSIPHPEFRRRRFVLAPLAAILPDWRDPVSHCTIRQLLHRLDRPRRRA